MPAPLSPDRIRTFLRYLEVEPTVRAAAIRAGVSETWAYKYTSQIGQRDQPAIQRRSDLRKNLAKVEGLGRPLLPHELSEEAKRALEDFAYFRRRYFGRATLPWQQDMAVQMQALIHTPFKEWVVVNVAPGGGKSTALRDLAAWMICRNRAVRMAFGSSTTMNAKSQVLQLRRELERTIPYVPSDDERKEGAVEAEAVMAVDYGLFRSLANADVWRAEMFVVVQHNQQAVFNKEATCMAISQEMEFIGNRFNLIFWDDLVTDATVKTLERIEAQRDWWDGTGESRLEPGGAMFLVGQRKGSADLYRWALDKKHVRDEDDDADEDDEGVELVPKYTHIVYRAHDETRCGGVHKRKVAQPWPAGCLLDPYRVSWREQQDMQHNNPAKYAIEYQQEDADPQSTLVRKVWVKGGTDPDTGETHVGCWDDHRRVGDIPDGVIGRAYSIATVDPSPTKWWAVQWWIYHPDASSAFLIDLLRIKMGGDGLLDWYNAGQKWTGVMQDWQERSVKLGSPIGHWIVEANAAQRFLLQYEHVHRWQRHHRVRLWPHQTTQRKLDPDLGVDTLASWWRFGQIRLPRGDERSRLTSLKLVDEVTKYPNPGTDDQVMANWFLTYHLPQIVRRERNEQRQPVPGFAQDLDMYSRLRSVG